MSKFSYESLAQLNEQELSEMIRTAYQVISDKRLTVARTLVRQVKNGDYITVNIKKYSGLEYKVINVGRTRVKVEHPETKEHLIFSLAYASIVEPKPEVEESAEEKAPKSKKAK